nr:MAG TPA: hypothetical protein [Caudoviricetes sp.]
MRLLGTFNIKMWIKTKRHALFERNQEKSMWKSKNRGQNFESVRDFTRKTTANSEGF